MIMGLNKYIDHTALKPTVGREELEKLCMEAAEYDFASVCVNPCNVAYVKELLKNTDVNVCTVIGFPLGANTSEVKAYETEVAYKHGCDEFDMVINDIIFDKKNFDKYWA
jgi:deoxyribose-phosphate aldolase